MFQKWHKRVVEGPDFDKVVDAVWVNNEVFSDVWVFCWDFDDGFEVREFGGSFLNPFVCFEKVYVIFKTFRCTR